MFAIISDIHSNLEALTAVLADIDRHHVERIVCLGDIVGYGPDPVACIDLVRQRCGLVILGNHDQATLFDPEGWGRPAEQAIFWTRSQLETSAESKQAREKRWEFLAERPRSVRENGMLFVHGSARQPLNEYVFPEDIFNPRKLERIFALVDRTCFQGHTHIPGIFVEQCSDDLDPFHSPDEIDSRKTLVNVGKSPDDLYRFHSPNEIDYLYHFDSRKTLVNVGSVGQPRDGDPRARYVLVEGELVLFRRVEYDVETTIRKIHAIPDLENFLGDRLRDGR